MDADSTFFSIIEDTVSMESFKDTKPHYALLDGFRGVAAIMVLIYHVFEGFSFAEVTNGAGSGLITVLNHGHIAVDFFFMLSGFVISYACDGRWRDITVWQFFKRRLIRLQPMLVMGAIIGAITFAIGGFMKWNGTTVSVGWTMTAMLLTMLMIPAFPGAPYEVRGNGEMFPLNGPGWSLLFEYIGNILYAVFVRRLSTRLLALMCAILGVLHAWFFIGDLSGYDMIGVGWTLDGVNFFGGLLRMLFPFTVGMLLARTFKPGRVRCAFWVCSIMLLVLLSVPYIPSGGTISINSLYEFVCIAFVFPCIIWLGASGVPTASVAKISQKLGQLSYPLYIVHYPIMYLFYAWLIEKEYYALSDCPIMAFSVVVSSLVLAYAAMKLYDEPVRRWLARMFR